MKTDISREEREEILSVLMKAAAMKHFNEHPNLEYRYIDKMMNRQIIR